MNWEPPGASFTDLLELRASSQQIDTQLPGYSLFQTAEYRWLVTAGDSIQSVMDRRQPDALVLANQRAMGEIALQLVESPAQCLDLGTGGGAFLRFLLKQLPETNVCSVEQNGTLVSLARRYFAIPDEQAVHIGDASAFLRATKSEFDLVLVDLFIDDQAPESFRTSQFFGQLDAVLKPAGAVAMNTLPHSSQEMLDLLRAALGIFPYLATLQFEGLGNVLMFLSKSPLPSAEALASALAPRLQKGESPNQMLASWRSYQRS